MKRILTLILCFILLFFFFDVKDVNTIDDIALIYDNDSMYDEKYYSISFYEFYLSEFKSAFKDLDITILSITPANYEKMEYISVDNIIERVKEDLIENGKEEQAINVYENNFRIKSMVVISTKEQMLKLERRVKII